MTLGFLICVGGAAAALLSDAFREGVNSPIFYVLAKIFILGGWAMMIFGICLMVMGILVIWWSIFARRKPKSE